MPTFVPTEITYSAKYDIPDLQGYTYRHVFLPSNLLVRGQPKNKMIRGSFPPNEKSMFAKAILTKIKGSPEVSV